MTKMAKLKVEEFDEAISNELKTISEFAKEIGTSQSYLSRIKSTSDTHCSCSSKFARRVLQGFNGKYRFDDLFFWVS